MKGITDEPAGHWEFLKKTGVLLAWTAVRNYLIALAVTALVLAGISATVSAQTPNPFSTAAEHAGMAAQAKELAEIHLHLHHVLNCLEGSSGRDYKKVPSNPCTGKGALQTLPKGSTNLVRAHKAIDLARIGVTLQDVQPAHYVAQAVHAILTEEQER